MPKQFLALLEAKKLVREFSILRILHWRNNDVDEARTSSKKPAGVVADV